MLWFPSLHIASEMNDFHSDSCPECGALWVQGLTCQEYFHQMLFWEAENPALGEVHHLMVLCYYIQHPSLYSPAGLAHAHQLLADFVEKGITPQEVRQRQRASVDSGQRRWKVTGTTATHGCYDPPIHWPITAADVVVGGAENYCENVKKWGQVTHEYLLKRRGKWAPTPRFIEKLHT
jgi:hypothetical protein